MCGTARITYWPSLWVCTTSASTPRLGRMRTETPWIGAPAGSRTMPKTTRSAVVEVSAAARSSGAALSGRSGAEGRRLGSSEGRGEVPARSGLAGGGAGHSTQASARRSAIAAEAQAARFIVQ